MPTAVILPKLGNTVESSIIARWLKRPGETVAEGEALVEIETDKSSLEVASPATGVLLDTFYAPGDDVPVLTTIAAIGQPGEDASALRADHRPSTTDRRDSPSGLPSPRPREEPEGGEGRREGLAGDQGRRANDQEEDLQRQSTLGPSSFVIGQSVSAPVSPRARRLAEQKGLDLAGLAGSGPGGRVIERDVQAALAARPRLTPLARALVEKGGFAPPAEATGRVTSRDLTPPTATALAPAATGPTQAAAGAEYEDVPLSNVRRLIAERMLASLQTTAQLTLNASADARQMQALRQRLKASPEALGLREVTVNDLVLFAVSRTLIRFPDLNALFLDRGLRRYIPVHLGFAVDTPRGLLVPVIRHADSLSLRALSQTARRLAQAAQDGKAAPDDLSGGTFTVTNLGSLGIESFTPVLNPPQVAILGVGSIQLKPVDVDGEAQFIPHLGLSLTINHQVVDGAPGARFLHAVTQAIASLDLLLAT